MKKKTLISLTVVVLLLVAGASLRYCACRQPTSKDLVWSKQLSKIKTVLKENENFSSERRSRPIQIVRETDLTGDGVAEALVATGSGGAYADDLVLFTWVMDEPVLAKFINDKNEETLIIFSEGASVRNGMRVDWQPEQRVIYSGSWSVDFDGSLAGCGVNAYQYDDNRLAFVYHQDLSVSLGSEFCANLRQSL